MKRGGVPSSPGGVGTSHPYQGAPPDPEALRRGRQTAENACTMCQDMELAEGER